MLAVHLLVDARCLQDEGLRFRGVGQFAAAMLQRCRFELDGVHLTAIIDSNLPCMPDAHATLFDSVATTASVPTDETTWFLQCSPMTHGPAHIARCLSRLRGRRIAIVHDFIPLDMPSRYLQDAITRFDYETAMSALVHYDIFVSNSQFTQRRLREILGQTSAKTYVSGVPVRAALIGSSSHLAESSTDRYVLAMGGGDPRKNIEAVIVAHARSELLRAERIRLLTLGAYSAAQTTELTNLFASSGGTVNDFEIISNLSDEELARKYHNALVTVCPSLMEGFSIPVVEANANGSPVIVSNCPAQTELIPWQEDQFEPTDVMAIQALLEQFAVGHTYRADVVKRQAGVWSRFTVEKSGQRFWGPIAARVQKGPPPPALLRKTMPRVAFVTPMPPARSGVADYSMAMLRALSKKANVCLFSDTVAAQSWRVDAPPQPISSFPYIAKQFDAVTSVIGNSELHRVPFDMLLEFGGAAIAHDARMIDYYYWVCGKDRTARQASVELKRRVSVEEVETWIEQPDRMETLFLGEIVRTAAPVFVHSKVTQTLIKNLYNTDVVALPFCVYRGFPEKLRHAAAKKEARRRLQITDDQFLVVTLGNVAQDRLPGEVFWSIKMLRSWKIDAVLAFVGTAPDGISEWLRAEAREWGIDGCVRVQNSHVNEKTYLDYLAAADAAVQLRLYDFGGLSGALSDCIEAALPTVGNSSLAEAMEAPEFVRRVPNAISPVLIAEQLAAIYEEGRDRPIEEAQAYCATHNFDLYANKLLNALGFEPWSRA